jgi:hypothetical protein
LGNPKNTDNGNNGDDDVQFGKVVHELMISQFQMEKLRTILIGRLLDQYILKADVYYAPVKREELSSSFEYPHKGRAYRITIDIEEETAP